jgi:ABC-type branched-subunit amino acid transport system ATPase component
MTGLPILEISGLNKSYGAVRAVDDVSLHVNRGEICGLIGPNGSGKSTFFDCASGLTRPHAGTVKLDGQDITGWSLNRIAREGRMLRSFQKTVVFSALDVEENLVIAGQMFTFPGLWSTFGIGAMARARVDALREYLKAKLPVYMTPSVYVFLEALPLSPNGKVDRKALPEAEVQDGPTEWMGPRNAEEEILCGIFAAVIC